MAVGFSSGRALHLHSSRDADDAGALAVRTLFAFHLFIQEGYFYLVLLSVPLARTRVAGN